MACPGRRPDLYAAAILDRLVLNADRIDPTGESLRRSVEDTPSRPPVRIRRGDMDTLNAPQATLDWRKKYSHQRATNPGDIIP
jgi:hypothetical protein